VFLNLLKLLAVSKQPTLNRMEYLKRKSVSLLLLLIGGTALVVGLIHTKASGIHLLIGVPLFLYASVLSITNTHKRLRDIAPNSDMVTVWLFYMQLIILGSVFLVFVLPSKTFRVKQNDV
jgi:hypothetical protein